MSKQEHKTIKLTEPYPSDFKPSVSVQDVTDAVAWAGNTTDSITGDTQPLAAAPIAPPVPSVASNLRLALLYLGVAVLGLSIVVLLFFFVIRIWHICTFIPLSALAP